MESAVRLKESIEESQDKIVQEMINEVYKIAGSYIRKLIASLGIVRLKMIKPRRDGKITSLMLDILGIMRERYFREVKMKLVDMASFVSYGEASKMFRNISGIDVPKKTIHRFA